MTNLTYLGNETKTYLCSYANTTKIANRFYDYINGDCFYETLGKVADYYEDMFYSDSLMELAIENSKAFLLFYDCNFLSEILDGTSTTAKAILAAEERRQKDNGYEILRVGTDDYFLSEQDFDALELLFRANNLYREDSRQAWSNEQYDFRYIPSLYLARDFYSNLAFTILDLMADWKRTEAMDSLHFFHYRADLERQKILTQIQHKLSVGEFTLPDVFDDELPPPDDNSTFEELCDAILFDIDSRVTAKIVTSSDGKKETVIHPFSAYDRHNTYEGDSKIQDLIFTDSPEGCSYDFYSLLARYQAVAVIEREVTEQLLHLQREKDHENIDVRGDYSNVGLYPATESAFGMDGYIKLRRESQIHQKDYLVGKLTSTPFNKKLSENDLKILEEKNAKASPLGLILFSSLDRYRTGTYGSAWQEDLSFKYMPMPTDGHIIYVRSAHVTVDYWEGERYKSILPSYAFTVPKSGIYEFLRYDDLLYKRRIKTITLTLNYRLSVLTDEDLPRELTGDFKAQFKLPFAR